MTRALKGKRLLNLQQAGEHYIDGYRRGIFAGEFSARQKIINELLNDSIITTQFTTDQIKNIVEAIEK